MTKNEIYMNELYMKTFAERWRYLTLFGGESNLIQFVRDNATFSHNLRSPSWSMEVYKDSNFTFQIIENKIAVCKENTRFLENDLLGIGGDDETVKTYKEQFIKYFEYHKLNRELPKQTTIKTKRIKI